MAPEITLGLSLSLTGKYGSMGRQAAAALRMLVDDLNARGGVSVVGMQHRLMLDCFDDASRSDRVREIYRELCFGRRRDLIFGPYSSDLTRAALPITASAGMLLVNHGGADDALHDRRENPIVSVLTPASEYLSGFVQLLATLKFWRKRLAIASSGTAFAAAVVTGAERAAAARRAWLHGVHVRLKFTGAYDPDHTPELLTRALRRNRINAFVSVGSYAHDLAMMRLATAPHLQIPVIGCVAAGVTRFRADLGDDAEGIVGPSQWEPEVQIAPALGPRPGDFARRIRATAGVCDYPAAQIYAAGLLTAAALRTADSLAPDRIQAAFADLRTTTLFGDFAVDRASGRQIGHKMLLVQWHGGHKQIIEPDFPDTAGHLDLPSAWRMLFPATARATLHRRDAADQPKEET